MSRHSALSFAIKGNWSRGLNLFSVIAVSVVCCVGYFAYLILKLIFSALYNLANAGGNTVLGLIQSFLNYVLFIGVRSTKIVNGTHDVKIISNHEISNVINYSRQETVCAVKIRVPVTRYPSQSSGTMFEQFTLFFSGPRRFAQIRWMLNTDCGVPMIMAHRGYSAKAPENTLPAFQRCMDEGFTAAELDVQMLADGTIVVMHDDNLKRTAGINKNVWEVTYDEIEDLDNGSFFSREYAGTKIPTLDEVLKLCGSGDSRLYLNIEIKRNGHDDRITEKVVDIILANDYLSSCDITSQDYRNDA